MSRTSIYNRNYVGKKIEKGAMPTHEALKIVHQYINNALTIKLDDPKFSSGHTISAQRLEVIYLFNMALDHCIRVSNNVDITYIKNLVNSFMADNENGNSEVLKLVCSFIETLLHQSDSYHGFNNYKWSSYGSNQLHVDYPSFNIAEMHSREDKYNSQEYHRIYY